jgi:hypothetical protein
MEVEAVGAAANDATTAPVVGDMVRVPSLFETEVTDCAKHGDA